MVAMALMQYLALTTRDILPYGLDNLSYYASSPGIIIPEVVSITQCDMEKYYHSRKWVRLCTFLWGWNYQVF